ncbi:MAG TPA: hypothetical protein PKD37_06295 [Oligoflexia bacterium]|nr:hypothetical protein [Oligoflexia bacterium]HMP27572.1 hypothetical protein [Oligoflexia bacterium]
MRRKLKIFAIFLVALLTQESCGGGKGDSNFVGAALVYINAEPRTIDRGDRTRVTINIEQVHPNGILLKLKYPTGLGYVAKSARIGERLEQLKAINPAFNLSDEVHKFTVFTISRSALGEKNKGLLRLELTGLSRLDKGVVAVDADVNDPKINDEVEFDINDPQFEPEDLVEITVRG